MKTAYLKKYWNRSGALRHRFDLVPVEILDEKQETKTQSNYTIDPKTGGLVATESKHVIDYCLIQENGKEPKWVRKCELKINSGGCP